MMSTDGREAQKTTISMWHWLALPAQCSKKQLLLLGWGNTNRKDIIVSSRSPSCAWQTAGAFPPGKTAGKGSNRPARLSLALNSLRNLGGASGGRLEIAHGRHSALVWKEAG
jgi:hypothetical protein